MIGLHAFTSAWQRLPRTTSKRLQHRVSYCHECNVEPVPKESRQLVGEQANAAESIVCRVATSATTRPCLHKSVDCVGLQKDMRYVLEDIDLRFS